MTGTMETSGNKPQSTWQAALVQSGWSSDQLQRFQALARIYRLLDRNAPVPMHLLKAARGIQDPGEEEVQQRMKEWRSVDLFKDTDQLHPGPDVALLKKQRELVIENRMERRRKELAALVGHLPPSVDMQAQLELKQIQLLKLQRQMRSQVANCNPILALPTLDTVRYYRQVRPGSNPEDGLNNEDSEWAARREAARQMAARAQRDLFLKDLKSHTDGYVKHLTSMKELRKKLANDLRKHFDNKDKQLKLQEQRRLQALRAGDMTQYREYLDQIKDQRLKTLLDKTQAFLDNLGAKVSATKSGGEGGTRISDKEKIIQQPSMLGGQDEMKLKGYQLEGLNWLVNLYNNKLSGILADEMGLGKTIQVIAFITYLVQVKQNSGPFLVIVPLATINNWRDEFAKWAPDLVTYMYRGNADERQALFRDKLRNGRFNVLLIQYELVHRKKTDLPYLSKIHWSDIIIDEGHRLKNRESLLFQTLKTKYTSDYRLILSGTPLQNDIGELWAMLNFLMPNIFDTDEEFESWFAAPFVDDEDGSALDKEAKELVIRQLHQVLRPFMLRRLKDDVLSQLPTAKEAVLRTPLSSLQTLLYSAIMHKTLPGVKYNNALMQLRKVCNHPFMLETFAIDGFESVIRSCGKFNLLDKVLFKLKNTGHRVLIYSQMVGLLKLLEEFCEVRKYKYFKLDGSTSQEDRAEMIKEYNKPDSEYFLFLLSTRAGGQGLNLQTADTVLIFDNDWNPMMDEQAKARVHRIGQTKDVLMIRFVTPNTVEEKILAAAQKKLQVDDLAIESGMFHIDADVKESHDLLKKKLKEVTLGGFGIGGNISTDEEVNEMIARSEEEIMKFEELDQEFKRQKEERYAKYDPSHQQVVGELTTESEIPNDLFHPLPAVGGRCLVLSPPMAAMNMPGDVGVVEKIKRGKNGEPTMLTVKLESDGEVVEVPRILVAPPPIKTLHGEVLNMASSTYDVMATGSRIRQSKRGSETFSHGNMSDAAFLRMCETGETGGKKRKRKGKQTGDSDESDLEGSDDDEGDEEVDTMLSNDFAADDDEDENYGGKGTKGRGRGRPKGSANKGKKASATPAKATPSAGTRRGRGGSRTPAVPTPGIGDDDESDEEGKVQRPAPRRLQTDSPHTGTPAGGRKTLKLVGGTRKRVAETEATPKSSAKRSRRS